jgi:RNA polymerase sigma factor (sigma-70 family)
MLNINAALNSKLLKSMSRAVERAIGRTNATDDIVSDAVVRILANVETFDESRGSFESWALRIASNTARNWRKASANNGHMSSMTDDEGNEASMVDTLGTNVAENGSFVGPDGRLDVERRSEMAWLASAVDTLDSDARTFVGAMLDGMGQTEAGALVGWSPATATRRMRAIVETLADEA